MKNILFIVLLFLAGFFSYNYFTPHSTEVVVREDTVENQTQELVDIWDNIDLPEEIRNYSSIEGCDTSELRACFGSGAAFYKETEDVTVSNLISTSEISRYGVQVKETGEFFIFSVENKIPDRKLDSGNTTCYLYEGDEDGVFDTRELKIDIYGTTVVGIKSGYNSSNEYSVGYKGVIEGEINSLGGDTINAITTLTLSGGGEIRQEERYVLGEKSITEIRYVLKDDFDADILRIDEIVTEGVGGQVFPIEYKYNEIGCNKSKVETVTLLTPSKYICFNRNNQNSNKLMFGLDDKENALFAQYKNQEDIIELDFVSKDFPTPGYPTYTLTYKEIVGGKVNGTYVLTHSGNYDYVKYINNEGKIFNFTNIPKESYVNNSCL